MDTDIVQLQAKLDPQRQQKAREYQRQRLRLSLVNMAISIVGVCIFLFTNVSIWLRNLLGGLTWQPVTGWYPLQILCYFVILMLGYEIITFPISYYRDFVIVSAPKELPNPEGGKASSHRYGLSVMTLKGWLRDLFVGLALELVLGSAMVEVVYLLLATQPQTWWLWVALAWLFFSVVMANLAPVLLFPLFYKFRPLAEGELSRRLLGLAQRAHTRVRGVYTFDMSRKTTMANAALMGLGNTRRIVLGDTMLEKYTDEEIEVVLAHELGHHVHHDIWKLLVSRSLLTLGGLYVVNVVFHWAVETRHLYLGLADVATIPLLLALISLFWLVVMPLNNGLSRTIESQADEYALQATRMVEPFKSAMTRLANQNLAEVEPSPLIEFLFYSHPSMGKRLRHADEFAVRTHGGRPRGSPLQ